MRQTAVGGSQWLASPSRWLPSPALRLNVAGDTAARAGKTITLWDYLQQRAKGARRAQRVAQAWAKKTGNKVVNPGDVAESMQVPAGGAHGPRPDIIQFPHDNLGRMARQG